MMRPKLSEYFLHLLLFTVGVITLYGSVFFDWTHFLMGSGEDTMKNFFTFAYYIVHDDQWLWFTGMNHPYGEHLTFTDNQPFIAWWFKLLNSIIPLENQISWMLPVLLLLSFQIGAYFLFRTLKLLKLDTSIAMLASVAIMFLSPQWSRLGGHYSLAHGFFLPLLLFLLVSKRSSKNALFIGLLLFISGFIHPYFIAMGSLFTCLYLGLELISSTAIRNWRSWLIRAVTIITPLVLFQVVIWLTDPVLDRPSVPFGYLYFRATLPSILLPLHADYALHIMRLVPGWTVYSNEGSFYIGAAAIFGTTVGIIAWSVRAVISRHLQWNETRTLWVMLLAAIPVMLLSIGVPFIYEGYEHYLEHAGPLRQFRGISRFAFVFFYVINLFAFGLVSHIWNKRIHQQFAGLAMVLVLAIEIWPFRNHIVKNTVSDVQTTVELSSINSKDYDAILPLPYFHIGSENFGTRHTEYMASASMRLGLTTGIPLIGVQMSRTSLDQTVSLLSLTGEQLAPHPLAPALSEETWLLLVDPLSQRSEAELSLMEFASEVGAFEQFKLFRFKPSDYQNILAKQLAQADERQEKAIVLPFEKDSTGLKYSSFDELPSQRAYRGNGALEIQRKHWTPILEKGTALNTNTTYELTFWTHFRDEQAMNTQVWFWERFEEQDLQFSVTEIGDHVVAFDGDWALCRFELEAARDQSRFELLLHRDEEMLIWVDEVLLRPLNTDVRRNGSLNLNNRYYKPIDQAAVDLANY